MKKIFMTLFVASALILTSCGGAASTENKPAEEATATETVVASSPLDQYSALIEKAIPLAQKMKSGDVSATQEYTTLAQEIAQFAQDNQEAFSNLSADEAQKLAEIGQKFADAMK